MPRGLVSKNNICGAVSGGFGYARKDIQSFGNGPEIGMRNKLSISA